MSDNHELNFPESNISQLEWQRCHSESFLWTCAVTMRTPASSWVGVS